MQTQGTKIQNLATAKGIKQIAIVKRIGWTKSGFSRKVNGPQRFDPKTLSEIADFLGVKPEYIKDESRPFYPEDEIPLDAIAEPTPEPTPPAPDPSDAATILARTQEAMVSKWPEVLRAVVRAEMEKMMLEIIELRATVERLDKKSNQP